jgi:hypothetical protein
VQGRTGILKWLIPKILSPNSPGETEENHDKAAVTLAPGSGYLLIINKKRCQ